MQQDNGVGEKNRIRLEMRKRRSALAADYITKQSELTHDFVVGSSEFREARIVGSYSATASEVQTDKIFQKAAECGKVNALPRTEADGIKFYEISGTDRLVAGRYGIMEPAPASKPILRPDLILVPGVAFDRLGYRIGYGKGYYDRYLNSYSAFSIGLAFPFQVMDKLPHDVNDAKLSAVASSEGIMRFNP